METVTLHDFNEKRKLVECFVNGTGVNSEKKYADNSITKNKYRNSNSDEVNQLVYEVFKDMYIIDTYRENGYEHIRLYSIFNKHLYVILRESTFQEQIDRADDENTSIHYLYAYAMKNKYLINEPLPIRGQLEMFEGEIVSARDVLIQNKANIVMKNMDVEVVQLITYNVVHGKVISAKSRVLHPDIVLTPIYEEDLSHYIVGYNNEDDTVGFVVESNYSDFSDQKQDQEIQNLLKLKSIHKDQDE
ncbi:hypothetical protein J7E78_01310 [Paenibacillus polymyxa]|uniref:hypothetical protein n=1 Tax=Paenibacillus polymyxa TaxID=1406 RepID=UPI001BEAE5C4|nr:hypothetical protein [Paenibacillus polymyxa]MBT2282190.1 hypothetical protein [Paenibacillus polymyxa]